jgi:hypothetical protein
MVGASGSDYGGGVGTAFVAGSHLELVRTTVMENFAALGGGLGLGGEARLRSSLIQRNTAGTGAGIYNDSDLLMENVTVTDNLANTSVGGLVTSSGDVSMRNVTIVENQSGNSSIAANVDGFGTGTTKARNTIIAKPRVGPNCDTELTSNGHNLEDSNTCGFTKPTDLRNRASRLRPLRNNGGRTRTHALKPSSPARDAGGNCLAVDQRGVPRPGSRCDIGAYEFARCSGVIVNRVGTRFFDVLEGTSGADGFLGLADSDDINGRGGADGLCGGKGPDVLKGAAGNDDLVGGGGDDDLQGGPGRDECIGGPGDETTSSCESRRSI